MVNGTSIYPNLPKLAKKTYWACMPCRAWVGCHPHTITPLGILANAELRQARMAAHAAFDPLWTNGKVSRSQAYGWLAQKLGLAREHVHIGMFDKATCQRVVDECREMATAGGAV
jgi:hypothetical protein